MLFGIWLVTALIFLVIELTSPTYFLFLSFSLAGVVTAIASLFIEEPAFQITIFVVSAAVLIGTLYMFVKRYKHPTHATNVDALIGTVGRVTHAIEPHKNGRVMLGGQDWAARSDEHLVVGQQVRVIKISGVHLSVKKLENNEGKQQ